jgi:hypothetical protein
MDESEMENHRDATLHEVTLADAVLCNLLILGSCLWVCFPAVFSHTGNLVFSFISFLIGLPGALILVCLLSGVIEPTSAFVAIGRRVALLVYLVCLLHFGVEMSVIVGMKLVSLCCISFILGLELSEFREAMRLRDA